MTLTIGKKLTSCFLMLALLVLLSGIVGIIVLNKVSECADTVAKEKVPVQYSIMKANLTIESIKKSMTEYLHSVSEFDQQTKNLQTKLDEFNMWILMLKYGTLSDKFRKTKYYKLYKALKLKIIVPQTSKELLKTLDNVLNESIAFQKDCEDLIKAHNKYQSYSVTIQGKNHDLPSSLLILQKDFSNWFKALEDAVNIVTLFNKNTDPAKGILGTWTHTYKVEDKGLNKLVQKMKKYHGKILGYAKKINNEPEASGKIKLFNRSKGMFVKIEQYFTRLHEYAAPVYKNLNSDKTEKLKALNLSAIKINKELEKLVNTAEKEMSIALKDSESSKQKGSVFLIILTIAAVLIALVLGLLASRYLTTRITSLADVTKLISQGDLNNKVNISSNDELGSLADDTNIMTENLRKLINKISDYSTQLTKSSSGLDNLASSMSDRSQNMTTKSESVAAAAEQMSSNMNSIAATSEQASANINTVSIATNEINSAIKEIAKNSEAGISITKKSRKQSQCSHKKS